MFSVTSLRSTFHCFTTVAGGVGMLVTNHKMVFANQKGCTHLSPTTGGCQMIADWSLGLCDSDLIHLLSHCHCDCPK